MWNLALIYVILAFKSVGVILVCDHVNEAVENLVVARHRAVLFITLFNQSRSQRPRSFWSATGIATSGLHSGQTTRHARDLSPSGLPEPSGSF